MIWLNKFTVTKEQILVKQSGKTMLGLIIAEMGPNKGIAIDFQSGNKITIFPIFEEGNETKIGPLGKIIKEPSIESIENEIRELIKNPAKNYC